MSCWHCKQVEQYLRIHSNTVSSSSSSLIRLQPPANIQMMRQQWLWHFFVPVTIVASSSWTLTDFGQRSIMFNALLIMSLDISSDIFARRLTCALITRLSQQVVIWIDSASFLISFLCCMLINFCGWFNVVRCTEISYLPALGAKWRLPQWNTGHCVDIPVFLDIMYSGRVDLRKAACFVVISAWSRPQYLCKSTVENITLNCTKLCANKVQLPYGYCQEG